MAIPKNERAQHTYTLKTTTKKKHPQNSLKKTTNPTQPNNYSKNKQQRNKN